MGLVARFTLTSQSVISRKLGLTSSSFRDVIARDLRSGCDRDIFSGQYEDMVVEHSCKIVRIACGGAWGCCRGDALAAVVVLLGARPRFLLPGSPRRGHLGACERIASDLGQEAGP